MIRQPIITVLGHVDHGKTSVLDYIRHTTLAQREAGQITQHIGATEVPLDTIKKICGPLLQKFKLQFTIPGLLFIDTPGHEAFTNLRKRGGSIADLAIVVIDIMQGVQPQTIEAIQILKAFKVPFIVAANKVDLIVGWKQTTNVFTQNLTKQLQMSKDQFDNKFYKLVGQLSELGFNSELYSRVDDYTKTISIVPVSAKTGEGMAELLAILTGLAQKFLEKKLEAEVSGRARGTILEIKEEKGFGVTADVIIYDGKLEVGDTIIVGTIDGLVESKVRGLFKPAPLQEVRDAKTKWKPVQSVAAATGVKILANDLDTAGAGGPIISAPKPRDARLGPENARHFQRKLHSNFLGHAKAIGFCSGLGKTKAEIAKAREEVEHEIESVTIETAPSGVILKTDTLGSLEAIAHMLKSARVPIQRAEIGNINKNDVADSASNLEKNPALAFVLGFNVRVDEDAKKLAAENNVTVLAEKIIYHLIDKYEEKSMSIKSELEKRKLEGLAWPCKLQVLKGYVFRASKPAVFGVEILAGKLKTKAEFLTTEGKEVGEVKGIEVEKEKMTEVGAGKQAAISVDGVTVGRQVNEGDTLYVAMTEDNFRKLKEQRAKLNKGEIDTLKEIAEIKRKTGKGTWGI